MEPQAKKKTFWSTFKNAYLRSKNLKNFWNNLDKKNLSNELQETFEHYLNSESYNWSSKFWRHLTMNHLNLMANSNEKNYKNIISQEYFTFTYFNEAMIKEACDKIKDKKMNMNVNLFKKQDNFTFTKSINHNLILLLLYENIKSREVFKFLNKLKNTDSSKNTKEPFLLIDGVEISQDNLNSLFEYEQIDKLLSKVKDKKNTFLEVGAGSGRTAKSILSIRNNAKYVIADIPPAINICSNNLKNSFPNKKIIIAFKLNNTDELNKALHSNDILLIFPHQIKFFNKKTFDISIAID